MVPKKCLVLGRKKQNCGIDCDRNELQMNPDDTWAGKGTKSGTEKGICGCFGQIRKKGEKEWDSNFKAPQKSQPRTMKTDGKNFSTIRNFRNPKGVLDEQSELIGRQIMRREEMDQ